MLKAATQTKLVKKGPSQLSKDDQISTRSNTGGVKLSEKQKRSIRMYQAELNLALRPDPDACAKACTPVLSQNDRREETQSPFLAGVTDYIQQLTEFVRGSNLAKETHNYSQERQTNESFRDL
jgi:hypothetical protein